MENFFLKCNVHFPKEFYPLLYPFNLYESILGKGFIVTSTFELNFYNIELLVVRVICYTIEYR